MLFLYKFYCLNFEFRDIHFLTFESQTTQWERPQEPAEGTAGSVTWADDIIIDSTVAGVEDAEKISSDEKRSDAKDDDDPKLPAKQWFNDLSPIAEGKFQHPIAEEKLVSHKNDYTEFNMDTKKISENKVDHDDGISDASSGCISPAISIKSATSKCNLNYGRVTTAQLDMLSTLPKDGHLMKQSASFFSSRWNRKYFVLNGLRLECYEKSEDYFYGLHKPVVMGLTLSTCTSFTDDANTFVVKTTDDAGHTVAWTLAAPNHTEKNEWVRVLLILLNLVIVSCLIFSFYFYILRRRLLILMHMFIPIIAKNSPIYKRKQHLTAASSALLASRLAVPCHLMKVTRER